eukprot:4786123-Prymnesium_polylepis.1
MSECRRPENVLTFWQSTRRRMSRSVDHLRSTFGVAWDRCLRPGLRRACYQPSVTLTPDTSV